MKDTTLKKILIVLLVCALIGAGFALLIVSVGHGSFIVAFIACTAAVLPICAELIRTDKRISEENEDEE